MFSVGLDEFENLILYAQLIAAKIENNQPFISPDKFHSLGRAGESACFYSDFNNNNNKNKDASLATPPLIAGEEVKEIIFGSLLGDAKIELPPRGLNARFGFTQSLDKKEYFLSVLNSLGEICSGKYREMSYLDNRTGKTYANLNF
jgi:LAGLIDADG DNA endonuclease family